MPEVPSDWRPRPARVWGTTRRFDQGPDDKPEEKPVIRGGPQNPLTFEQVGFLNFGDGFEYLVDIQRGAALGEEQRVSKAKSVWEYVSEKDRERLASLAAQAKSDQAPPPPMEVEAETQSGLLARSHDEVTIPPLSPRTASAALKGYVPYGDDLNKQERYRSYLVSQTYNTQSPNPTFRTGSIEEINKELEDFAASARIFKPMSFAMSSRFTSGSSSLAATDMKQAKPGLHLYDAAKAKEEMEKAKAAEEVVEEKKYSSPREQAAADGRYGELTRTVKMFYPVKLLCRRFGVQDPHPEGPPQTGEQNRDNGGGGYDDLPLPKNDAAWESGFIHQDAAPAAPEEQEPMDKERRPRNIEEVGMAGDVNQGRDTLSYTKPSIDIFKAIFASDDEDDGEDEVESKPVVKPPTASVAQTGNADPFPVKDEGPVDLATFKPVFTRAPREQGKERKKEKKDKKKRKGVLSFEVGDEEDDAAETARREERKKRRKQQTKEKVAEEAKDGVAGRVEGGVDANSTASAGDKGTINTGDGDDGGEWVEKAAIKPRMAGRKGASDYM